MRSSGALLVSVTLTLAWATPAHAQKAEADAAFQRGRDLMAKGETAKACAEFEASMRLEPQRGTLYNLALCHEQLGKIASAWTEFKELADTDKNAARAQDSARRAATLEKKLTRMRIVLSDAVDGLIVERDGLDVTPLIGDTVPVDPARYTFVASAPGHETASIEVDLTAPGETIDVTIPPLEPEGSGTTPAPPEGWPDPYALPKTLRPLILPRRVLEATALVRWSAAGVPDGGSTDPRDPVEGVLGARLGLGRFEVNAALDVHLRYEQLDYRPTLLRAGSLGAAYVITPMFGVRALYRRYHPLGGDIDTGSDFRADVVRKHVVTPKVALVGSGGVAFEARDTRGSEARSEFALAGAGAVQLAPIPRVTVEAIALLNLNLGGNLYDHTLEIDIGAGVNVAIRRRMDAFAQVSLDVTPSSNTRTFLFGVNQRFP